MLRAYMYISHGTSKVTMAIAHAPWYKCNILTYIHVQSGLQGFWRAFVSQYAYHDKPCMLPPQSLSKSCFAPPPSTNFLNETMKMYLSVSVCLYMCLSLSIYKYISLCQSTSTCTSLSVYMYIYISLCNSSLELGVKGQG